MPLWILVVLPIVLYILAEAIGHMYLELFEHSIPHKLARFLTPASWVWEPRSCGCHHCHVSSRLVEFHNTIYESFGCEADIEQLRLFEMVPPGFIEIAGGSTGLQILCQDCWMTLPIDQRWTIYESFLLEHPGDNKRFCLIKQATLAGK